VKLALFILLLCLIAGGIYWFLSTEEREQQTTLVLYGNVDVRQVDIGFRVEGRVLSMPLQEGDLATKGILLATVDKQPYLDQVKQAEAALTSARVAFDHAELIFKRRTELVDGGGVSKEDYEDTRSTLDTNAAALRQAEAALGVALTNLRETESYAPADGVILTRIREPGTVVKPSDPVCTLSLVSPVWVRAYVSEPQLGLIYPGMFARVFTDTPHGKIYEGHIGFISPVSEFTPKTVETTQLRTDLVYRLRVIVDNPDDGLRQGMPVTVHLPLARE
jgi:HlyD family secretion protein